MASLGISSLVKYLTSLFFHSISVTKLCGLFLRRKSVGKRNTSLNVEARFWWW